MTNEEKEQSGQIPPKINLKKDNGNGGEGGPPPKAKSISGPKSDTSRIDLPGADKNPDEDSKSAYDETMRVVLPKSDDLETGTLRKKTSDKPKKTIKIKRPDNLGESTEPTTMPEEPIATAKSVARPKQDTSRIDISKAQLPPSPEQMETAKEDTMRVILDEMSAPSSGSEQGKPARTIKIKRDSDSKLPADDQKETVVGGSSEEKSATAKLDIPDSISESSGGKKTIRIKRSGAGGGAPAGKTLKISRPSQSTGPALSAAAEESRPDEFFVGETRPHAVFTVAAMLTVIVSGVLIYLMCTQMPFGDSWQWPGKIITEWQGSTSLF